MTDWSADPWFAEHAWVAPRVGETRRSGFKSLRPHAFFTVSFVGNWIHPFTGIAPGCCSVAFRPEGRKTSNRKPQCTRDAIAGGFEHRTTQSGKPTIQDGAPKGIRNSVGPQV